VSAPGSNVQPCSESVRFDIKWVDKRVENRVAASCKNAYWYNILDSVARWNFNKKPNSAKKGQKKANFICGIDIPLPQRKIEKFKLQEYQKNVFEITIRLTLAWQCVETGAHYYWYFSDFSWFMRLHTLGTTVRQFAYWSTGSFLHPYESHLPITSILTTRIIAALPLLDVMKTPQGKQPNLIANCFAGKSITRQRRMLNLRSRKFVSKSLDVKWSKKTKVRSE